jgi:hypothetical protein
MDGPAGAWALRRRLAKALWVAARRLRIRAQAAALRARLENCCPGQQAALRPGLLVSLRNE